jgi:hypothetical protein
MYQGGCVAGASVNGLTRYRAPHATSRVFHIALTTRNEVYVSVATQPGQLVEQQHACDEK